MTETQPNFNPNAFTTAKKHKNSISASNLFTIDDLVTKQTLFEGNMVHLSVDCPFNLRTAFNNACKANGTSTCKIIQQFAANYIMATTIKEHALANTNLDTGKKLSSTTVNIGISEMNFNRMFRIDRAVCLMLLLTLMLWKLLTVF
jgi:hypothetical protein